MGEAPDTAGRASFIAQALTYEFRSVLDIGTGDGAAARAFARAGRQVTATGFDVESYFAEPMPTSVRLVSDLDVTNMRCFEDGSFDAVWCSHVLEHVLNTADALREIRRVLRPGGLLFLIVPEYSPYLVGGHVCTGWNLGTMMYALVLTGFDVRGGSFVNHCWQGAGFVRSGEIPKVSLRHDIGDIETLRPWFPPSIPIHQGLNGDLASVNWTWHPDVRARAEQEARQTRLRRLVQGVVPSLVLRSLRDRRLRNQYRRRAG